MPAFVATTVVCLVALAAGQAFAGTTVATGAERPALRVDARGNAEISWTSAGVRRYLLVPPTGRVYPGRRLPGRDVSRASTAVTIPFRRVLRRSPDGRHWALQTWRVLPGGPVELRFSRWRGALPQLTLATGRQFEGELLTGTATLAGRPFPLYSPTPEGKRIRSYVYVDRWTPAGWSRTGGAATRADGTWRLFVPTLRLGMRYRAVAPGPNVGGTLAPDAVSRSVPSSR